MLPPPRDWVAAARQVTLAKIDTDGSGDIDFDEFLAFSAASSQVFDI